MLATGPDLLCAYHSYWCCSAMSSYIYSHSCRSYYIAKVVAILTAFPQHYMHIATIKSLLLLSAFIVTKKCQLVINLQAQLLLLRSFSFVSVVALCNSSCFFACNSSVSSVIALLYLLACFIFFLFSLYHVLTSSSAWNCCFLFANNHFSLPNV